MSNEPKYRVVTVDGTPVSPDLDRTSAYAFRAEQPHHKWLAVMKLLFR